MIGYLALASCVDFPLQDGKIGERLGERIIVLKGSGINARANAGVTRGNTQTSNQPVQPRRNISAQTKFRNAILRTMYQCIRASSHIRQPSESRILERPSGAGHRLMIQTLRVVF